MDAPPKEMKNFSKVNAVIHNIHDLPWQRAGVYKQPSPPDPQNIDNMNGMKSETQSRATCYIWK